MYLGLQDASAEEDLCKGARFMSLSHEHRNEHNAAEYRRALHAIGMSSGKALHERGQIGIVWTEFVSRDRLGGYKLGTDDLHVD